ncbi:hypothetical protein RZR97_11475 [Hydrogenimonas thermophila]|uniref:hypothetical protein n=1 Tax=Hydrogenimonas thermophila TaxID=223786 RepID=UPI00293702DB|nr:hypothetical protein [Hydrogenimonas thermophila]WOE69716.1 hypothetical protein RZR91_11485 [Hydrogenimonas thermophila]WOE72230.1 hypothetical protein RZR97_11475 [Hydrogenimonas thermophila]
MQLEKVIYLQDGKLLFFDGHEFTTALPKHAKKFPVGATIPSKILHTYLFKTSNETSKDQLDIEVEIKVYENGGLDPNVEYVIDYLSHNIENSDSVLVEVLAVPNDSLEDYFKEYTKKINTIDYIVPTFLTYKSLYTRGISDDKTDLFIYFSEDESLASIFKNGEYIAYKQIDSLNEIAQKSNLHLEELKKILLEKGFEESRYESDEEEAIYNLLVEIFTPNIQKIIHVVNNKRSIFGLDGIDRIWLDFNGKLIPGLDHFYSFMAYEEIEYKAIEIEDIDGDNIHAYISASYFLDLANSLYDGLNFTIYERKPPVYKLELFKLTLFAIVGILINGAIDSYFIYQIDITKNGSDAIRHKLKSQKKSIESLQKKLKSDKQRSEELKKVLNRKAHEIKVYKDTLIALDDLTHGNLIREEFINDILVVLQKFNLSTSKIIQKGNYEVEISLIAEYNQRERIAKFIEALSKKGYQDVSTGKISLNNGVYESTVRIVR